MGREKETAEVGKVPIVILAFLTPQVLLFA